MMSNVEEASSGMFPFGASSSSKKGPGGSHKRKGGGGGGGMFDQSSPSKLAGEKRKLHGMGGVGGMGSSDDIGDDGEDTEEVPGGVAWPGGVSEAAAREIARRAAEAPRRPLWPAGGKRPKLMRTRGECHKASEDAAKGLAKMCCGPRPLEGIAAAVLGGGKRVAGCHPGMFLFFEGGGIGGT